ncbi:MAG: 3-hydroxyacyl-ACP dehydratase FabZ family protein [Planctomycetota bacterium]
MRWFWVDRITEFVSGSHAGGIKNVALDEEVVDEYRPAYPCLPPTLIIEGIAQLGGVLVAQHFHFEKRVVLAKVGKAIFHQPARTGDQLQYRVQMDGVQPDGATVIATSHCDDVLQAEVDLMFAFLDPGRFTDGPLFGKGDLESMLRLMGFYEIAVDKDGNSLPKYEDL